MKKSIAAELRLPEWVESIAPSAMEKSLQITKSENFISFALGLPAVEYFPHKQYLQAVTEVMDHESAFQYSPPHEGLKDQIVEIMALRGVSCTRDEIMITSGAQQSINLLTRLLLSNQQKVIMEELAYPGMLQNLLPYQPEILTVSTDPYTGMNVDAVEELLKSGERPALLYIVTDGGNPMSVRLSLEKRKHLAALAAQYALPIIEDDPYGFLSYEENIAPLKAFENDWVFYVGSFSKVLSPALRTGWIVAPKHLLHKLGSLKECTDINTTSISQRTVHAMLQQNIFVNHVQHLSKQYAERRNTMVDTLKEFFPDGTQFNIPENGIFIWVTLPTKTHAVDLLIHSQREAEVAFIPGSAFRATNTIRSDHTLRLNFSHPNTTEIKRGIQALARVIHKYN